MNRAVFISDGDDAPKSAGLDTFDAQTRSGQTASGRRAPTADSLSGKGGRIVALHDGPDAAGDPAALAELIEAIATRADKAAFARLFGYFAPRVKAYLIRLGLESAQAEEVSQEVMVAVWRKAASYDPRQASVSTWIFRIARNRRIDAFRRDQRNLLDAHDPGLQPMAEPAPDTLAEAAERDVRVRVAMDQLPVEQRDLVRAAFYEDLSHSQIAERTGMPLGTVKSRLRQAFGKLRLRLVDEGAAGVGADA